MTPTAKKNEKKKLEKYDRAKKRKLIMKDLLQNTNKKSKDSTRATAAATEESSALLTFNPVTEDEGVPGPSTSMGPSIADDNISVPDTHLQNHDQHPTGQQPDQDVLEKYKLKV